MASKWNTFLKLPVTLRVGAIAVALGPAITIGLYAVHFRTSGLSQRPDDWAAFGSYVGGVLGWLVSLIALMAVYATYLKQQESDAHQRSHLTKTIALLETQNQHLENQVQIAKQEAFDTHMSSLVIQLIQSIGACSREHKTFGMLVGQAYFHEYAEQLWSNFVDALNQAVSEPLKTTRQYFFSDESSWLSIRGQLELLISLVYESRVLSNAQRSRAMSQILAQLTPGIATFLAIDSGISHNASVLEPAGAFGLFRHVDERLQSYLTEDLGVAKDSFENKRLASFE